MLCVIFTPLRSTVKRTANDLNVGSYANSPIEINDVLGLHPNTTITSWTANGALFGSAMDVDEAAEGIGVILLLPSQPHDTGHNRITTRGIGAQNLSGWATTFENSAKTSVAANLLRDFQLAERSTVGALSTAESKFRG